MQKKLIKKMWGSSVDYSDEDLTPELCDWVIGIYLSHQDAHKKIKSLKHFIGMGPWTSVKAAAKAVMDFLTAVAKEEVDDDWGLGVRASCRQYKEHFKYAVAFGDTSLLSKPRVKGEMN